MKKLLVCITILAMVLAVSAFAADDARLINEEKANMYNTVMLVHFMQNGYPDHYGGAHIDAETGHLVIKVKGLNEDIEKYYYELTDAEFLMFEEAEKSFNELWEELHNLEGPGYIDESENKVVEIEDGAFHKDIGIEYESAQELKTYTVVKGDCLWNIAKKYLGKGSLWTEIFELNKDIINNPDMIYVGQVIKLP